MGKLDREAYDPDVFSEAYNPVVLSFLRLVRAKREVVMLSDFLVTVGVSRWECPGVAECPSCCNVFF